MTTTATAYSFDEHGHYKNAVMVMNDPISGELLLPEDCVTFAPDEKKLATAWAQLNDDKTAWNYTTKPTTAAECVGMYVKHTDQCPWAHEVRALFEALCEADKEHYRVVRDDELTQTVEAIPEKTLEEVRTEKLQEVDSAASQYQSYNCKALYITSSLGFKVNADQCSQKNMEVLISLLPDDETTTTYKIYDNSFKELTKPQLKTLLSESEQNGVNLYQQKFAYQAKIKACTTISELNAIEVKFEMMDFSK